MLHVQNLQKSYGVATILSDVSFVLNDGERVGLIGPNGTGKSTLLRCIVGLEPPDRGNVLLTPIGAHIGYLQQAFAEADTRTVGEVVDDALAEVRAAEADLLRASEALATADGDGSGTAMQAYDLALTIYEALGGYARAARAEVVLPGLGLGQGHGVDRSSLVQELSGGQKTRLGLATLLLREPDLLLLDEPTNHLDVEALEWLEGFLAEYPRAVLVVSHDRTFLNATVSRVLYLDPETRGVRGYTGGYSDFAAARAHERDIQLDTWRREQEYVARVRRDIGRLKSEARSIEESTTAAQPGLRRHARRKAAVAKSREHKLDRYLASDERVERPKLRWPINLNFGTPPPSGRSVLRFEDVSFGYQANAGPILSHVSFELGYGQRLAVVGPNGAGKTTLLRLISGELAPDSGRVVVGAGGRVGVMAQEQETLDPSLSVLETVLRERAMSEQDARSFLPYFLFKGDSVFKQVGACSLGERSRLQLARLVLQGCNLLLLDEPINHLDVESREHFEAALKAFEGTVVVVAHDRAFLGNFARRMLDVRNGAARLLP